eukprot:1592801-Pyramimonas_sp.AAC.1
MEGWRFSTCDSRVSAAHMILKGVRQLQGWRAFCCSKVVIAVAPRTFILKVRSSFQDSHG